MKTSYFAIASCIIGRNMGVFDSARFEKSFDLCAHELFTVVRNQYTNGIAWGEFSQHMRFRIWRIIINVGRNKFTANRTYRGIRMEVEVACTCSEVDSKHTRDSSWSWPLLLLPLQAKRTAIKTNCLVFTLSWCVSCDNLRTFFRNKNGTTIRFPIKITPSQIDNSLFVFENGLDLS